MGLLDIAIILIVVVLGFNVHLFSGSERIKQDLSIIRLLWLYHLMFGILFYFYVLSNGGDAISYWQSVKNDFVGIGYYFEQGIGTDFIFALNYFPSKILDLSFLTGSLLYSLVGFVGFILYYRVFEDLIPKGFKLFGISIFPLILFLPNLHFWSASVGKDSIVFFCIALFLNGLLNKSNGIFKICFALALTYFIRPHIAAFLLLSLLFSLLIDGQLKIYIKFFFGAALVVVGVLLLDNILLYLRVESLSLDYVDTYSSERVSNLSRGHTGSSVDVSGYPFPLKVFTFLYRPLFFDVNGILALLASFENLILLLLSILATVSNPFSVLRSNSLLLKTSFFFLLMGTVSFSMILGNLGIMMRQKNMFIPSLLLLCLWIISLKKSKKLAS